MDTADSTLEGTAGVPPAKLTGGIPDLSLRQAEELNRLGQLQETYTADPSSSLLLWSGFLVFFLLFGLLVSAIPFLPPPKDVAPAPLPLVLLLVLVSGFILVACVWRLRRIARERRTRILVFAEGLARFDGKSLLTCRWEEIESVQGILFGYKRPARAPGWQEIESVQGIPYKGPKPFAGRIILTIRGGKQLRMYWVKEHLAVMNVLFQRVSEESSRHLLPRFLAAIEAGQTVTFVPHVWGVAVLGISKLGLHWGRHVLAWNNTEEIDVKDGLRIRITNLWSLGHPWVRLEDIPIPNYLLFLRLAEHNMRHNGRNYVPRRQD